MIRIPSSWHVSLSVSSSTSMQLSATGSAAAQSLKHFMPECIIPSMTSSNNASRRRRKRNKAAGHEEPQHDGSCSRKGIPSTSKSSAAVCSSSGSNTAFSFPRLAHSNNHADALLHSEDSRKGKGRLIHGRTVCIESEDDNWCDEDCEPSSRKKPRIKKKGSSSSISTAAATHSTKQQMRASSSALVPARKRRKKRRGCNNGDSTSHPSVADLMMGGDGGDGGERDGRHTGNEQEIAQQSGAQASLSLFGMGLLHRLEMQAKQRRKNATITGSAEGSSSKKKGSRHEADQQQSQQHMQQERRTMLHYPPRDRPSAAQKQGYALDDQCIYNFKEAQTSACFPRQSAQEACQVCLLECKTTPFVATHILSLSRIPFVSHISRLKIVSCSQVILDAISKCNSNDARRHHHTGNNEPVDPFATTPQPPPPEVNLDHILSCVPYRDLLQDLFGKSSPSPAHGTAGSSASSTTCVPVVTKTYEESFMREPMWEYERPCVMGSNCECNFISTRPNESFVGVEFILPFEASLDASERSRQMCVLCHRKLVQSLFYDIMYSGAPFHGVIQRYGNICNHAGLPFFHQPLQCHSCLLFVF